MYEQSLGKIIYAIKRTHSIRLHTATKWEYGKNEEHDVVVISKTGQIGEVVEIQNLRIALPKQPVRVHVHELNKWVKFEQPNELARLKNIFDWRSYPEESKEQ